MAWTPNAPTLPAGSSYKYQGKGTVNGSNFYYQAKAYIARLEGNEVSIKCTVFAKAGDTWNPPGNFYFKRGDNRYFSGFPGRDDTITMYWRGTILPGAKAQVKFAAAYDASTKHLVSGSVRYVEVIGPETTPTDKPIYINTGTVYKIKDAYINIPTIDPETGETEDSVYNCKVFTNVGGVIYELK